VTNRGGRGINPRLRTRGRMKHDRVVDQAPRSWHTHGLVTKRFGPALKASGVASFVVYVCAIPTASKPVQH